MEWFSSISQGAWRFLLVACWFENFFKTVFFYIGVLVVFFVKHLHKSKNMSTAHFSDKKHAHSKAASYWIFAKTKLAVAPAKPMEKHRVFTSKKRVFWVPKTRFLMVLGAPGI